MRILIVEQNEEIRDHLVWMFERNGFIVDQATDGAMGLSYALRNKYLMVLTDIGLSEMCGLTMIKKIRERNLDYPILVYTTRTRWQDKVLGFEAGADDYLCIPSMPEKIMARAQRLMLRPNRLRPSDVYEMTTAAA